jgi:hypothetical protein
MMIFQIFKKIQNFDIFIIYIPFHIEIFNILYGFFTNNMFNDIYKVVYQYFWWKA